MKRLAAILLVLFLGLAFAAPSYAVNPPSFAISGSHDNIAVVSQSMTVTKDGSGRYFGTMLWAGVPTTYPLYATSTSKLQSELDPVLDTTVSLKVIRLWEGATTDQSKRAFLVVAPTDTFAVVRIDFLVNKDGAATYSGTAKWDSGGGLVDTDYHLYGTSHARLIQHLDAHVDDVATVKCVQIWHDDAGEDQANRGFLVVGAE